MSTLLAHTRKTRLCNLEDLQTLSPQCPAPTNSFRPIDHHVFASLVLKQLQDMGFNITDTQFAVSIDAKGKLTGDKMFGVLKLADSFHEDPSYSPAIGIRSSWDKSMAPQMIGGGNVFVCDNLAFSGEHDLLYSRQTSGKSLVVDILRATHKVPGHFLSLNKDMQQMRSRIISRSSASEIILDAANKDVIPHSITVSIFQEYLNPSFEGPDFTGRHLWSLNNAFTHCAKSLSQNARFTMLMKTGAMFKDLCRN